LREHRQRVGNGGGGKDSGVSAKMTFQEAAEMHLRNLDNNGAPQTADPRLLSRAIKRALQILAKSRDHRNP
jgi:hypothetical protein